MKEDLVNGLRSGYQFMLVHSVEVSRVTDVVRFHMEEWNEEIKKSRNAPEFLKEFGYTLKVWNVGAGLHVVDIKTGQKKEEYKGTIGDPLKALEQITVDHLNSVNSVNKDCAGVYVFHNLHLLWDDPMMKPMILNQIIHLAAERLPHRHVVFVGPYDKIPLEVAHLLVPINFALPTKEDLLHLTKKFDSTFARQKVKLLQEEKEKAAEAAGGMTLYEAENAFRFAIVMSGGKALPYEVVQDKKAEAVKKTGMLEYCKTTITREDIGGMHNMVQAINELEFLYHHRKEAREYGIPMPKGWLITGISGTGKSLVAKGIANIFGIPLFTCDLGRVFDSLVGGTEKNTLQLLNQIEAVSPAVIMMDEIEKSLSGLESSGRSDGGVTSRMIGRLLTFMQDKKDETFFCATANSVHNLPPELLRKGRFNQIWFVDLPNSKERTHIFEIHIRKVGRNPENFDLKELVKRSDGCTGAEIEGFISDAMYRSFPKGKEFDTESILECIDSTPLLSKTKEVEIKELRDWARGRARIANVECDADKPAWYNATTEDLITN